jgi:hypothetical protein
MGTIRLFSRCSGYTQETITTPNPNKYRFQILDIIEGTKYDLVKVHYPDCTTFNGIKLLLVHHNTVQTDIKVLDPHFLEDNKIIARFKPNEVGAKLAYKLVKEGV